MFCLCKIYNKKCLVQHVLPEKSTLPESCTGTHSAHLSLFLPDSEQKYHLVTLQLTAKTCLPFITPTLVLAEGQGGAMEQVNCSCFPMKMRPFGYSEWPWQECREPEAWGLRWTGSLCSKLTALLISPEISFPWRKMTAVVGKGCSILQGPGMCSPHICLLQDPPGCNREGLVSVVQGLCQEGYWVSHGFFLPDIYLQKEPGYWLQHPRFLVWVQWSAHCYGCARAFCLRQDVPSCLPGFIRTKTGKKKIL